jgi:phage-related tail protein
MKVAKSPRIVLENEEVEKSQVILAAQDMIDTVQKMYEDINDMLVKELPALVDSIQSEIGVNESDTFNQSASQALTTLNASLQETQMSLKAALGGLTGQGGADAFAADAPEMDADLGAEMGADLDADMEAPAEEPGAELPPIPDLDDEEEAPLAAAGRPRR